HSFERFAVSLALKTADDLTCRRDAAVTAGDGGAVGRRRAGSAHPLSSQHDPRGDFRELTGGDRRRVQDVCWSDLLRPCRVGTAERVLQPSKCDHCAIRQGWLTGAL